MTQTTPGTQATSAAPARRPEERPAAVGERPDILAASWYVALPSSRLGRGPTPVTLFGLDLVAWRDDTGRPVVMPRHCPHQGASLALGRVVDGCLRCPFHGWRFEASGRCVHIPNTDRIPSTARQPAYPTDERHGYVWVWYGGDRPAFTVPDFPPLTTQRGRYIGFRYTDRTRGTARILLENAVDYYHFLTLHGLKLAPVEFRMLATPAEARDNGAAIDADAWHGSWFDGTVSSFSPWRHPWWWLVHTVTVFGAGRHFQLLVDGWPAGQRFTMYVDGREIYKVLLAITPTRDGDVTQLGWAGVRRTGHPWRTLVNFALLYAQSRGGTAQDVPIYDTTRAGAGGFHVLYDKGVLRFRRYYQKWADRVEPMR